MKTDKQARRHAKRLFQLCLTDGLLNEERVRTVVKLITESMQRDRFAILAQFRRLVQFDVVQHTALVESAAPLSDGLRASVQLSLVQTYGGGLKISYAQSPGLIAGMRIKVGSDVFDGSVKARLAELESQF